PSSPRPCRTKSFEPIAVGRRFIKWQIRSDDRQHHARDRARRQRTSSRPLVTRQSENLFPVEAGERTSRKGFRYLRCQSRRLRAAKAKRRRAEGGASPLR